jgi:hypothetical protein
MDDPDALALIAEIAAAPTLDRFMVLSPVRFASSASRRALCDRLRSERVAWELKRGDRQSASAEE